MKSSTSKRIAIPIALATMLLAAPVAQARVDKGAAGAGRAAPAAVRIDSDGFSWPDAGIGAGAALAAVVVAGGAGHALRRRPPAGHS